MMDLAERAVVVEACEGGDVFARDAGRILRKDERICVGWVGYHQHLAALGHSIEESAV